jgi:K+-sensing histidine kinase KdpD
LRLFHWLGVGYDMGQAKWPGGAMPILKRAIPLAVSLAVVCVVTFILLYLKEAAVGPHHPIFLYLLPIGAVAVLFGSLPALLSASAATACAAFFLYDPPYSFLVSNHLEVGELVCFGILALIGVKCTGELLRPPAKVPASKSRFGRG